ncbi:TolC family outer membrane protein [Acinetobacter boissieri]|uniref:Outer membrane protein n=1 Tax=Acinetobacter boissieri TaxID=1219383 RepID=A0A1G6IS58_9GAMM|nr:TolC family outer membrane protein [Acinetobacter boissieri]SDC09318.1 outer membrane protein [Acinetobacter boissieri]
MTIRSHLYLYRTLMVGLLLGTTTFTYALSLKEALLSAQNNAAVLEKSRYEYMVTAQQKPLAQAALLPQIGMSGAYQLQKQTQPRQLQRNSQSFRLSATQTIFNLSQWYKYKNTDVILHIAHQQLDLTEQQLLLKVSEAYFNVLIAQESLLSSQKAQASFLMQQKQAQVQFEKGVVSIVDVQEAQAGYESAFADELDIQAQLQQALAQLETYVGRSIALSEMKNTQLNMLHFPAETLSTWQSQATSHNLEIQMQEQLINKAQQELKIAKANYYPTVELSSGYTYNPSDTGIYQAQDTRTAYVGVGINLPLFTGGQTKAQVRQAQASLQVAQSELRITQDKVRLSVIENYSKVQTGQQRIHALETLVHTNETKVTSSTLGQRYGLMSNVERIRAEKELYDARLKLTQAKYQFLQAQINLLQITGGFSSRVFDLF